MFADMRRGPLASGTLASPTQPEQLDQSDQRLYVFGSPGHWYLSDGREGFDTPTHGPFSNVEVIRGDILVCTRDSHRQIVFFRDGSYLYETNVDEIVVDVSADKRFIALKGEAGFRVVEPAVDKVCIEGYSNIHKLSGGYVIGGDRRPDFLLYTINGTAVLQDQLAQVSGVSDGLVAANAKRIDEDWNWKESAGYIDLNGTWVIGPSFFSVRPFRDGVAAASVAVIDDGLAHAVDVGLVNPMGKWGLIGMDGQWLIHPSFDSLGDFHYGVAVAGMFTEDRRWQYTYINKNGEHINDDLYYEASSFERGVAVATTSSARVLIDVNGDALVVEDVGDIIDYDDNRAICRRSLGGNQFQFIVYEIPNGFVIESFTKTVD